MTPVQIQEACVTSLPSDAGTQAGKQTLYTNDNVIYDKMLHSAARRVVLT